MEGERLISSRRHFKSSKPPSPMWVPDAHHLYLVCTNLIGDFVLFQPLNHLILLYFHSKILITPKILQYISSSPFTHHLCYRFWRIFVLEFGIISRASSGVPPFKYSTRALFPSQSMPEILVENKRSGRASVSTLNCFCSDSNGFKHLLVSSLSVLPSATAF